ncbi:hypothetical protein RvY_00585 [Ramazzottius varieornatus]|uniref:Uncharacterized protein n=1 Tax=Ramazzottius varieornatus TaxID=947166 RepID=A0A1D1UKJ0_RAMVA|nr:hypothetical protein RvY_00585 [Ramazzottius varieornatus]
MAQNGTDTTDRNQGVCWTSRVHFAVSVTYAVWWRKGFAQADADNAILKAEGTLKEVRDTLQTLQQFNDVARRSEAQAK